MALALCLCMCWGSLCVLVHGPYPDVLTDVPELKPFWDRVSELQGPKRLATDKTRTLLSSRDEKRDDQVIPTAGEFS